MACNFYYDSEKVVKCLIEIRADIHREDNNGNTALSFACNNKYGIEKSSKIFN